MEREIKKLDILIELCLIVICIICVIAIFINWEFFANLNIVIIGCIYVIIGLFIVGFIYVFIFLLKNINRTKEVNVINKNYVVTFVRYFT